MNTPLFREIAGITADAKHDPLATEIANDFDQQKSAFAKQEPDGSFNTCARSDLRSGVSFPDEKPEE